MDFLSPSLVVITNSSLLMVVQVSKSPLPAPSLNVSESLALLVVSRVSGKSPLPSPLLVVHCSEGTWPLPEVVKSPLEPTGDVSVVNKTSAILIVVSSSNVTLRKSIVLNICFGFGLVASCSGPIVDNSRFPDPGLSVVTVSGDSVVSAGVVDSVIIGISSSSSNPLGVVPTKLLSSTYNVVGSVSSSVESSLVSVVFLVTVSFSTFCGVSVVTSGKNFCK